MALATYVGTVDAYELNVAIKVNIDEAIYLLSPTDTPLLTGEGSDGLSVIGSMPVDQITYSWFTEEILTPRSTLAATLTTAGTVMTVASGHRPKFSTGDLLRVVGTSFDEIMRVTQYGTTADTLEISRAYASQGTAAQYANNATVQALGTGLAEGADPENARSTDRTKYTSNTQIFGPTQVSMTRTEQIVSKYGVSSEWNRQLMFRTRENAIAREQAFLNGTGFNDTTLKVRHTDSLDSMITTNVNTTSTQLTVANIGTIQQTGYNNGGLPDILIANPASLGDLNDIADADRVRVTFDDPRRGRMPVTTVHTEFGSVTIARNRWCDSSQAFGIRREGVTRRIMTPLIFERLAKTGDHDEGQIVCEEGLMVKGNEHMFKFTALSY
jgi:hypothetical protein